MSAAILVAHAGHYVWVLYLFPIAVVIWVSVRAMIQARREQRQRERD